MPPIWYLLLYTLIAYDLSIVVLLKNVLYLCCFWHLFTLSFCMHAPTSSVWPVSSHMRPSMNVNETVNLLFLFFSNKQSWKISKKCGLHHREKWSITLHSSLQACLIPEVCCTVSFYKLSEYMTIYFWDHGISSVGKSALTSICILIDAYIVPIHGFCKERPLWANFFTVWAIYILYIVNVVM